MLALEKKEKGRAGAETVVSAPATAALLNSKSLHKSQEGCTPWWNRSQRKECYVCLRQEGLAVHCVDLNEMNRSEPNLVVLCSRCHYVVVRVGFKCIEELLLLSWHFRE